MATVHTLIFMEKGYDIYVGCMARAGLIIMLEAKSKTSLSTKYCRPSLCATTTRFARKCNRAQGS